MPPTQQDSIPCRLNALNLAETLRKRLVDHALSEHYVRDEALQQALKKMWSGPGESGGLVGEVWVEGSTPALSSDGTLSSLAAKGLFSPWLARQLDLTGAIPADRPLFSHQLESVLTCRPEASDRSAVIVSSSTGTGKTEAFLLPLLNLLAQEKPLHGEGCQAIILYPMNALVNDQVDRLYSWLRGQADIRISHFTSETPEDFKAANSQKVPEFEHCRARTRQIARGLETENGKAVPPSERLQVPQILITNYSMLEYMLCRPQDRVFFGKNLKVVVLDEAHLYTGTLAAEVALLLLRVYDKCGVAKERVIQMATSATIGSGQADELRDFASALFNRSKEEVAAILGKQAPPSRQPSQHPDRVCTPDKLLANHSRLQTTLLQVQGVTHLVVSEQTCDELVGKLKLLTHESVVAEARRDCQGMPALLLFQTLQCSPTVHRLQDILIQRKTLPLDELSQELWGEQGDLATQATISLLDLGAAARLSPNSMPLLPHRLHLFARSPEGVSVCLNPECSGKCWGPLGALWSGITALCGCCGSACLPLWRCGTCGEVLLAGLLQQGRYTSPPPWIAQPDSFGESNDSQSRVELFHPRPGDGKRTLNPKDAKQAGPGGAGCTFDVVKVCPHCQESAEKVVALMTPTSLALSLVAEGIMSEIPPLTTEQSGGNEILPARGRRLLAFSDSRGEAARLGPRLRRQHELLMVRSALARLLGDSGKDSAELLAYAEEQIAECKQKLSDPKLTQLIRQLREKELQEREREYRTLTEGGSILSWAQALAKDTVLHEMLDEESGQLHRVEKWDQDCWEKNFTLVAKKVQEMVGREIAQPVRSRAGTLESIGILEVTYPGIHALSAPSSLLGTISKQGPRKQLQDAWPDLVAALCDTLRLGGFITLDLQSVVWQFSSSEYTERWVSVSQFRGLRQFQVRRRFVRDVLTSAGIGQDELEPMLDQILNCVFEQLLEHAVVATSRDGTRPDPGPSQLPWLERFTRNTKKGLEPELRIIFGGLGLRSPSQLFVCSKTGHVWPRTVLGCAPESGAFQTLRACSHQEIDESPRVGRARREYRFSPLFQMGLWAEEHSAQLSPQESRRVQELFKAGVRNLLSATTTMELGIDIGGLSATFLTNVPPGKANYLQRAGRVGRRSDGSSVVVTFARSNPYDREVFLNTANFFRKALAKPQVFFERVRVITRHFHAWLLNEFFQQIYAPDTSVGAMKAFGTAGDFFGRALPGYWEGTARPALRETPLVTGESKPVWWNEQSGSDGLVPQFCRWLDYLKSNADPAMRHRLTLVFQATHLNVVECWNQLICSARMHFMQVTENWVNDYDQLLSRWNEAKKASQANAIRYQLKALHQLTVIESFADGRFLPRYGFPIGLHQLQVITSDANRKAHKEDQYRLSRPGLLALREYVPGSQILVGGKVITSRGLLKHWSGTAADQAIGMQCLSTTCPNKHFYYSLHNLPEECPICGEPGGGPKKNIMFPIHGFTTAVWDPPRLGVDVERVGQVTTETIAFKTAGEEQIRPEWQNFAGVKKLRADYREEGEILVLNSGGKREGFAICTKCGYADSEKSAEGAGRMELPNDFEEHRPLQSNDNYLCWKENEAPVLRHRHLGARQPTDIALLDLSKVVPLFGQEKATMTTLSLALKIAGTRLLELDSRELGSMIVPLGQQEQWGAVIYDNVPGGAGHALELLRRGREWLEKTRDVLYVDAEHNRTCRGACLACLLTYDAQALVQSGILNRQGALKAIEELVGAQEAAGK